MVVGGDRPPGIANTFYHTHIGYLKAWFGAITLMFYHFFGAGGSLDPPGAPGAPLDPLVAPDP